MISENSYKSEPVDSILTNVRGSWKGFVLEELFLNMLLAWRYISSYF